MKHAVLTTAFLASFVSTLSFVTPSPALAGSSLESRIRSKVMSVVGTAEAAIAAKMKAAMEAKMKAAMAAKMKAMEAKMKVEMEAKMKAAMEAKMKAAMEANAAAANGYGTKPPCPSSSDLASKNERPSLLDRDRCY
jgi:hypothetical protein